MRLRQLPQLYLRGAIANETMKHMSDKDRDNIDRLTRELVKMPLLAGHKHRFTEKLGHTIGGDYKNKSDAEQEFYIAVWRGLVHLLHHTDYSYRCDACDATEYLTHKSKPKAFDRRYPVCPACNKVRVTDPGDSDLKAGAFVDMDELQRLLLKVTGKKPVHTSAIAPIRGQKKIANHEKVLNDPEQLLKYFGEFIWNYFRQTLRENEIKHHQLEAIWLDDTTVIKGRRVCGPADLVAVEEINSLLTKEKVQHRYEKKANPIGGSYRIQVEILITNQTVSRGLRLLIDKYAEYGVKIGTTETEVTVSALEAAPNIEAIVVTPQPVCIQGRSGNGDDDEASSIDAYQHRIKTKGGVPVQEDGIAMVESNDLIGTIRESLSDDGQKVFDIMLGQGEIFDEFVQFQRGPRGTKSEAHIEDPRDTHIARFLGMSARQVKLHVQDIKVQCLAHNVGDC